MADRALLAAVIALGVAPHQLASKPRGAHPAGRARQVAMVGFMQVYQLGSSATAKAFGVDESTARGAKPAFERRANNAESVALKAVIEALTEPVSPAP